MEKRNPRTKSGWRDYLDEIASFIVRSRGKCERCGSKKELQCCHIHTRRYNETRWWMKNLMCLCAPCHRYFHDHPIELDKFVRETYGSERPAELWERLRHSRVWWEGEYKKVADELWNEYDTSQQNKTTRK